MTVTRSNVTQFAKRPFMSTIYFLVSSYNSSTIHIKGRNNLITYGKARDCIEQSVYELTMQYSYDA